MHAHASKPVDTAQGMRMHAHASKPVDTAQGASSRGLTILQAAVNVVGCCTVPWKSKVAGP
jgi:hypothetical protein